MQVGGPSEPPLRGGRRPPVGVTLAVAVVGVAAVAALSVLGTHGEGDATSPVPDAPASPAVFTTVPDVAIDLNDLVPTWLPGQGWVDRIAVNGPDALAVVRSRAVFRGTELWRRSSDGVWHLIPGSPLDAVAVSDLVGHDGRWWAVGTTGDLATSEPDAIRPGVWLSPDGEDWEQVWQGDGPGALGAVVAGPDGVVAVGWTGETYPAADSSLYPEPASPTAPLVIRSDDGVTFDAGAVMSDAFGSGWIRDVVTRSDGLLAAGASDRRPALWKSADAVTWTTVETPDGPRLGREYISLAVTTDARVMAVASTALPRGSHDELWWGEPGVSWEPFSDETPARMDRVIGALGAGATTISWSSPLDDALHTWSAVGGWSDFGVPDPCRCIGLPLNPSVRHVALVAGDPVVAGGAGGQPVLWSAASQTVEAPAARALWEDVSSTVPALADGGTPVYLDPDMAIVSVFGRGLTSAGGIPLTWIDSPPLELSDVTRHGNTLVAIGTSRDGPGVWVSDGGAVFDLVVPARDLPVAVVRGSETPMVLVASDAPGTELETIPAPDGLVDSSLWFADRVAARVFPSRGSAAEVQTWDGNEWSTLDDSGLVMGVTTVADRLVVLRLLATRNASLVVDVYDTDLRKLSRSTLPAVGLGEVVPLDAGFDGAAVLIEATGKVWITEDGDHWALFRVGPEVGVSGTVLGAVRSSSDVVLFGLERGVPTVWRLSGRLHLLPRG